MWRKIKSQKEINPDVRPNLSLLIFSIIIQSCIICASRYLGILAWLSDNRRSHNGRISILVRACRSAGYFLLSQLLPLRVDQTARPPTSDQKRNPKSARMWLINRASLQVSRGINSDAINRNQRERKDRRARR